MSIPYRTRRTLRTLATLAMVLILLGTIGWLCWVVWLQRYVVYTDTGAKLDFARSANDVAGQVPKPPQANSNISIYYNEGANAINVDKELEQLNGYYITNDMVKNGIDNIILQLERLPVGTPVMIDMKGPYGSFFYQSNLNGAVISQGTNISDMITLVDKIQSKGFYTIARACAFRDWNFGNEHVSSGLYMLNRKGLWLDSEGYFWLNPTDTTVSTWITSVVLELKEMGFNEVVLEDFAFPNTDAVIFDGDRTTALQEAASKLMNTCGADNFTLSFCVEDPTFTLPEGRCRMYLKNINATQIEATASKVSFEDPAIRMVLLTESGDTRYDSYSVLRSIHVAEEVEARKENGG